MSRGFQKRVEDFVCEVCGAHVQGDGYTNHCPHCLWSKHVDVLPGDRAAQCHGLMEPIGVEIHKGQYVLIHRCTRCGVIRRNRTAPNDNFDLIVRLAERWAWENAGRRA